MLFSSVILKVNTYGNVTINAFGLSFLEGFIAIIFSACIEYRDPTVFKKIEAEARYRAVCLF